ncbi:MAG: MBL fold metallo-hydrolase, partial [Bacteroidetes bacterium]|nr:MBL fold metallo-hydrolase [Bacteroidota bacterium]
TKECIIIDPGCFNREEKAELKDFIEKKGLKPIFLINTHAHIDHVLGNDFTYRTWKTRPVMHKKEVPGLLAVPNYAHLYGMNVEPSPEPEIFLNEGDKVKFGNSELDVLFTPGHSAGHITLVTHQQKFIISGDVLFHGSIGRTDLPGGDHETLISTIKTKLLTLDDDYKVYSGHGPATTIGYERKSNPFLQ